MKPCPAPASWPVILVLLSTCASPAWPQCCVPVVAAETRWRSDASAHYWGPCWLTADGLGNVYAGMVRDFVAGMHASRDGGRTWDGGDFLVGEGSGQLRVAAGPDGTLVAVYVKDFELRARTSTDLGAAWSAPVTIAVIGDPNPGAWFDVQVRSNGLTAARVQYTLPSLEERVRVAASSDFGRTWFPAVALDAMDPGSSPSQLLALDDSTVVFGWQRGAAVLTQRSVDAGASWEPPAAVNAVPASALAASRPGLASTGPGSFQVAYFSEGPPHEVRVALSDDGAASWGAGESVIGQALSITEPAWLANPRPGMLAVGGWTQGSEPGLAVNMSEDHGTSWLASPSSFGRGGIALHHARLAAGPAWSVVAVHDDYRHDGAGCPPDAGGTCESIFLQQGCGGAGAWSGPELRLDTDGSGEGPHSEDPELVTDAHDRIHVLWIDGELPEGNVIHHAVVDVLSSPRTPSDVGDTLRVARSGPESAPDVHLDWSLFFPPGEAGEHYHVHRSGAPTGPLALVSPDPSLVGRRWTDAAQSDPLVYYEVRLANACEIPSEDAFPHTVPSTCFAPELACRHAMTTFLEPGCPSALDAHPCAAGDASGPERAHRLVLAADTNLTFALRGDPSLLLVILDAAGSACVAGGASPLVARLPAGEYRVIVDAPPGVVPRYTLHAACR